MISHVPERTTYHSGETDELDDDEAANSIENTTRFSETVVKDLSHGLHDWACEDFGGITL